MSEQIFSFLIDVFRNLFRGLFLCGLFHELVPVRARFASKSRQVELGLAGQFLAFHMAVDYIGPLRQLFFQGQLAPQASRLSILPLTISLFITFIYCLCFYENSRCCGYLILTFYTVNELSLFTLHMPFVAFMNVTANILLKAVEKGNLFVISHFTIIMEIFQIFFWNLLFQILFLLLFWQVLKKLKKNLGSVIGGLAANQLLFLSVPSAIGFCFCLMLRSILYYTRDLQTQIITSTYPETAVLIPLISFMCLMLLIFGTVFLRRLMISNEQEMLVKIYQSRIADMEEYMRDVERLYDGIRGMRHDMKNYVADMELLLKQSVGDPETGRAEMRRYLDGLCSSLEELDIKYSTGNPVTDVVISRKMRAAKQENIEFECGFIYPQGMQIGAFDVSIILNNGLDNALEAAGRGGYIRLDTYVRGNMFFLEIRNTFAGALLVDETGRGLRTSKAESEGHGLGLKNIRNCADKYYGRVDWQVLSEKNWNGREEKLFLLTVMLQGKRRNEEPPFSAPPVA